MKTRLCQLLGLFLFVATWLPAQDAPPSSETIKRPPEQIDQLLGPIALYPDALIALMLPAATTSSDIVLAARYLQTGNDPNTVDDQPWEDSVRSLAHYPEIIKWMDQNLAWTKQLGDAFLAQPDDVMQSVQRLRTEAKSAGTLVDTPQQQVVLDGDAIDIIPAQPDVIYVPYYDPDVVYLARPDYYAGSYLTFGTGFPVGAWLSFDLDWGHRRIWVVSREERMRYWRAHQDWRHPYFPGRAGYVRDPDRHPWRPLPEYGSRPPQTNQVRARVEIAHPAPPPGAPPRVAGPRRDGPERRPDDRNFAISHRNEPPAPPTAVPPARIFPRNQVQNQSIPPTPSIAPAPPPVVAQPNRSGEFPRERRGPPEQDQRGREYRGGQSPAPTPPPPQPHPANPPPTPRPAQARPAPTPPPPANQPPPPTDQDDRKKYERDGRRGAQAN